MILYPIPSPLPPVTLPDPEVLRKYGVLAMRCLRGLRAKAKVKGREHRELLRFDNRFANNQTTDETLEKTPRFPWPLVTT